MNVLHTSEMIDCVIRERVQQVGSTASERQVLIALKQIDVE